MNAPANLHSDPRRGYVIVLEADPKIPVLERRLALLTAFYERKVMPTLIGAMSILGGVVVLAQIAKWIAR